MTFEDLADFMANNGRCAVCGTTARETTFQVDHILPRSEGGSDELSNLQVLCARCDQADSNRDAANFTESPLEYDETCRFCWRRAEWTVAEHGTVWALRDGHPVSDGHHLVLPKRHTESFFTMTERERFDANELLQTLREELMAADKTIEGFNIGANCGAVAGQTIFHAHIHLIPRRKGDTQSAKGGVRGVIPEKMHY
jgi:diadenosine tetraphosphate (Ap4A) HIT family hydrolase